MSYPSVSLCMIVKDEEAFLDRCLESVKKLVSEIIITDTGSTDRTIDIAKSHNARIFHFQWCDDFAAARNFSLQKATGDWILILDADEELAPESLDEIKKVIKKSDNKTAYFLNIINYLNEREKLSDATEVRITRLFPNVPHIRYKKAIHEEIFSEKEDLKRLLCRARVFHRGYTQKLHEERKKGERNINLLLKCIEREPENPFYYYHLGVSYYVQDSLSDCIEAFKKHRKNVIMPAKALIYLPVTLSARQPFPEAGDLRKARNRQKKP